MSYHPKYYSIYPLIVAPIVTVTLPPQAFMYDSFNTALQYALCLFCLLGSSNLKSSHIITYGNKSVDPQATHAWDHPSIVQQHCHMS